MTTDTAAQPAGQHDRGGSQSNALGIHLLDYFQLELVRFKCEATGRWEFLVVAAPLRIVGGIGSPLNPIAIF